VLGYVDDVLLLPALIWLTIRLLPPAVLQECRGRADEWMEREGAKPAVWMGAVLVLALWVAIGLGLWVWLQPGRLGRWN
jgi:hypothetical protein